MSGHTRLVKTPEPEVVRPAAELSLPSTTAIQSVTLTILAVVAVVAVLHYAEQVIVPIVLAVLISYALDPVVIALRRIGLPRPLASAIVLIVVVTGVAVLGYSVSGQVSSIIEDLPQAARRVRQAFEWNQPSAGSAIGQVQQAAAELDKAAAAVNPTPPPAGVTHVQV